MHSLRNFTQNVDTLERKCGLNADKLVEAHGSFHQGKCVGYCIHSEKCDNKYSLDWMKTELETKSLLKCTKCGGYVKPCITFFGESLPDQFHDSLSDFSNCDLLIVLGTSLSVAPFASLVNLVSSNTPRLLINMELVGDFCIDLDKHDSVSLESKNTCKESEGQDSPGTSDEETEEEESLKITRYRDACYLGDVQAGIQQLVELLGWTEDLTLLMTG